MTIPFHPILFGVPLNVHLIFEILAFTIGFQLYLKLKKQYGDHISSNNRLLIISAAAMGALIGSRLIGTLENPTLFFGGGGELGWKYYLSQKTIVGGLLGGLLVVEMVKTLIGEQKSSGDLFVLPIILGLGIGRIGCFLMGIEDGTYGLPTNLSWGMDLGDGILRHPTALYEIIYLAILFPAVNYFRKNTDLQQGELFKFFMIDYLTFRLIIDFLKPGIPIFLYLTSIQWACLIGLFYYRKTILSFPKLFKNLG